MIKHGRVLITPVQRGERMNAPVFNQIENYKCSYGVINSQPWLRITAADEWRSWHEFHSNPVPRIRPFIRGLEAVQGQRSIIQGGSRHGVIRLLPKDCFGIIVTDTAIASKSTRDDTTTDHCCGADPSPLPLWPPSNQGLGTPRNANIIWCSV